MTTGEHGEDFPPLAQTRSTSFTNGVITATGIEAQVCRDIADRQARGIAKYGTTVADNPLHTLQWLQHMYEELLDGAIYAKRCMAEIEKQITDNTKKTDKVADIRGQMLALLPTVEMWTKPDYQGTAAVVQLRNLITQLPDSEKFPF